MKNKLNSGIGINDYRNCEKHIQQTWNNMLKRCYNPKVQAKHPTYIGCSVDPVWHKLSDFREWFLIHYKEGFELDKDILLPGNKVYGPDACRFVPQYINLLLTGSGAARGNLPLGVSLQKNGSYRARCNNGYGNQLCKTFKSLQEVVDWYSITKKRIVKEQAQRAFLDNSIKTDVYMALVQRQF